MGVGAIPHLDFDLPSPSHSRHRATVYPSEVERFSVAEPTASVHFHYFYHLQISCQYSDPPERSDSASTHCSAMILPRQNRTSVTASSADPDYEPSNPNSLTKQNLPEPTSGHDKIMIN